MNITYKKKHNRWHVTFHGEEDFILKGYIGEEKQFGPRKTLYVGGIRIAPTRSSDDIERQLWRILVRKGYTKV